MDHCATLLSIVLVREPMPATPCVVTSAILALRARHSYPSAEPYPFPRPLLLPQTQAEPSSSRAAVARRAGHTSPLRSISSRPKPINLPLHLHRPSPSPFEPSPSRIGSPNRRPPLPSPPSSAPSVELPSPAVLRPNQALGELPRAALVLTDPVPLLFLPGATGTRPCRRRPARLSPPPSRAALTRPRATPPRASGLPAHPGRRPAPPRRHLAPWPPGLLRHRRGHHGRRYAILSRPAGAPAPPVWPGRVAGQPPPAGEAAPPPSLAVATALARVRGRVGELAGLPPTDGWGPVVSPYLVWFFLFQIIYFD